MASEYGKTAYITGGASGIGKAVATSLAQKGINIVIADWNIDLAEEVAKDIQEQSGVECEAVEVDVSDWEQQVKAFKEVAKGRRIDYVLPIAGIGEKVWTENDTRASEDHYEEPNLVVIDVDLKGVLYTSSLAIQHFRRQKPDSSGIRGKIITVASVCGFYCVPTLPIYTTAKHGVVAFTRSYGKHLPEDGITLNAICPNIVQTMISSPEFYKKVEGAGVLVPLENVVKAVESFLEGGERASQSGECIEVGPRGTRATSQQTPMDEESRLSCELLHERARPLHAAKT